MASGCSAISLAMKSGWPPRVAAEASQSMSRVVGCSTAEPSSSKTLTRPDASRRATWPFSSWMTWEVTLASGVTSEAA